MLSNLVGVAVLVAAIGSGLVGGVFFGFTTTVMKSLRVIPASAGITAMQNINAKILNPRFVGVFMAATIASAVLAVTAFFTADQPGAVARGVSGLVYVAGVFLVTFAANIPLNDALAKVDPASQEGQRYWEQFLSRWNRWHMLRTIAAIAVATTLTLTLALTQP